MRSAWNVPRRVAPLRRAAAGIAFDQFGQLPAGLHRLTCGGASQSGKRSGRPAFFTITVIRRRSSRTGRLLTRSAAVYGRRISMRISSGSSAGMKTARRSVNCKVDAPRSSKMPSTQGQSRSLDLFQGCIAGVNKLHPGGVFRQSLLRRCRALLSQSIPINNPFSSSRAGDYAACLRRPR